MLLSDGLFTSFERGQAPDLSGYVPLLSFCREALDGKKLFVSTHTSIPTVGYANTTETTLAVRGMSAGRPDGSEYVLTSVITRPP